MTITDPAVMRALAHPARLAIIEHLAAGATGTATELAAVCGLSPSATSYHLRALARYGLVQEAPGRGDARERVWSRSNHRGLHIDLDPARDAESRAAERDLVSVTLDREDALARDWLNRIYDEPAEWREAAGRASGEGGGPLVPDRLSRAVLRKM
ncbi:MAG: helix-turn-helix domain-containing protein [Micromonosporaceae bacterium]